MPLYTWLMARSSDEIPYHPENPEVPEIRLDGWKLSFPSRPRIVPKELPEDQADRSLTGSSSETWTPGESIAIERRFHINHKLFLQQTGLPEGTRICLGIKWRVASRSAAGFEKRLLTLESRSGETTETVSTTMDGARLGGTVEVSTPITLYSIPEGLAAKPLAGKDHGRILWRGLDRSLPSPGAPLRIKLEGEGSRFPIRCVNIPKDPFSYFVEWSHIPKGSIDTDTMNNFLSRDPRTVFRVVVNTATDLGKNLIGNVVVNTATDQDKTPIVNHEKTVDWARKCWAHEIAGSIAQKMFHLCLNLDEAASNHFNNRDSLKFNHSGATNMGEVLAGFIEVMNPGSMTGNGKYQGLSKIAKNYFEEPETFVKAWQAKIHKENSKGAVKA